MSQADIVLYVFALHFVGDWLFQTSWMALNKWKNWRALTSHCVTLYGVLFIGMVPFLGWYDAWLFALVNGVAHFVIDAVTSRITHRLFPIDIYVRNYTALGMESGVIFASDYSRKHSRYFWNVIGFDQLLHVVFYIYTLAYWGVLKG